MPLSKTFQPTLQFLSWECDYIEKKYSSKECDAYSSINFVGIGD